MEFDHIFIVCQQHAPEVDPLLALGLTEGTPNRHLGQGTANRRIFFHNAFLEFLYLVDELEAQDPMTQPTQLYERLTASSDFSPFGICFRPQSPDEKQPSFNYFDYKPTYLPTNLSIQMVEPIKLTEPLWFFISFATRPDQVAENKKQPLNHALGLKEITQIDLYAPTPFEYLSVESQKIFNTTQLKYDYAAEHRVDIHFDKATRGNSYDCRPYLPLVLYW
ncbi:MAG: VOC family protein [Thiofilum sp.]|uniref:VOC family protein n=1 Tax=Thiofilum sp. TaxID=2212733 RepID=UPI0025E5A239|nr:VOC family protein [Thiofilum sp.]MBK8452726.1 VOC family protein [Thiofilum sp.]